MALKHRVDDITSVDEKFRGEYVEKTEGESKFWVLDVDGLPQQEDVGALKRAHERVKEEKEAALRKATTLGQDITALRADYDTRIDALKTQLNEATKTAEKTQVDKAHSEAVTKLATTLSSTSAAIIVPYIKDRVRTGMEDGRPVTRVLDKDGKLSGMSLTDLEAELRADKALAPVITGSRASGSGAGGERHGAGGTGADGVNDGSAVDLNTLSTKELVARTKAARQARGLER